MGVWEEGPCEGVREDHVWVCGKRDHVRVCVGEGPYEGVGEIVCTYRFSNSLSLTPNSTALARGHDNRYVVLGM